MAREHSILGCGPIGEILAERHGLDAPHDVARRALELKLESNGSRAAIDDLRFRVNNGLARALPVAGWGEDAP